MQPISMVQNKALKCEWELHATVCFSAKAIIIFQ